MCVYVLVTGEHGNRQIASCLTLSPLDKIISNIQTLQANSRCTNFNGQFESFIIPCLAYIHYQCSRLVRCNTCDNNLLDLI